MRWQLASHFLSLLVNQTVLLVYLVTLDSCTITYQINRLQSAVLKPQNRAAEHTSISVIKRTTINNIPQKTTVTILNQIYRGRGGATCSSSIASSKQFNPRFAPGLYYQIPHYNKVFGITTVFIY